MESLICEPGPRNPLIFLSLSIINRVNDYKPNQKETINQLECMHDLISKVSATVFQIESVKTAVAVAVDALLSVSSAEAKKATEIRISALECLLLLVEKLAACGINCFVDIIPGILSKTLKIITSRVEVEIEKIILLALSIQLRAIECFWIEQDHWSEDNALFKAKYRSNLDLAICSLKPLIKSERRAHFDNILSDIFGIHLQKCLNPSDLFFKSYLIQSSFNCISSSLRDSKKIVQLFNREVIEWFADSSLSELKSLHEEVLKEKIQMSIGLLSLNQRESILISDIFAIISKLTHLNASYNDISIEFSSESLSNIFKSKNDSNKRIFPLPSRLEFKGRMKLSSEFLCLMHTLLEKMISFDSISVSRELMEFEIESGIDDDNTELDRIVQKINLSSMFFKYQADLDLFYDCLKYHERSKFESIESSQMIHLATLKLIWSYIYNCKCDIETVKSVLLIVLSGASSQWLIMKEYSFQILKGISAIYYDHPNNQNTSDLGGFIQEHEKFILDRLACQLAVPSIFPEAPQIIACLIRDIVQPCTALSFTDLLVRKVSDNLALYQKHAAYCKDLLTVAEESIKSISRLEDSPIIDPKSFAFIGQNDNSDQATDEDSSNMNDKQTTQQAIIINLLSVGLHFILSDSKLIRSKAIQLVENGVRCFKSNSQADREPSSMCQLIHQAWPNLLIVLKDSALKGINTTQSDILVLESCSSCFQKLFEKFPLFMRDRFVKDFWRLFVLKCIKFPKEKLAKSNFTPNHLKALVLLFNILKFGIVHCKPSTEICIEIADYFQDLLVLKLSFDLVKLVEEVFEVIDEIEPDAIWYMKNIQSGHLKEIKAPNDRLKSFSLVM
jgi:hypothetical protein